MRVLTTTIKPQYPEWGDNTETLPGWKESVDSTWSARAENSAWTDLIWAFRLFRARHDYDAVVTGFERSACLFALLQRIPGVSRKAHVMLDAFPTLPQNGIRRAVKRAIIRQILLSVARTIAFSDRQRKIWTDMFALSKERFAVVPYWAAVTFDPTDVRQGDYIFAGGDTERDYETLVRAADGLPYPVLISSFNKAQFTGLKVPPNVRVVSTKHDEYVKLMAGSAVVVVPLKKDTQRFAGQQTYLSAMLMGKPVIVADRGADDYIHNWETGIVVEPGDSLAMSTAISRLMQNRELAERIARDGQRSAASFTPERYFGAVLRVAEEAARTNGNRSTARGETARSATQI